MSNTTDTKYLEFNQEVIWDSNKPLFDIYFKEKLLNDKYIYTFHSIPENLPFNDALNRFK